MTKRQVRLFASVLISVMALLWAVLFPEKEVMPPPSVSALGEEVVIVEQQSTTTNALVARVVDGDTIEALLDGASTTVRVRLLGINTPESVDPRRLVECFGKESSRFLKEMIEGKRVRLEEDLQADERDKYGRLLRNVVSEDGTDVNARLVSEGYAHAYLSFPLNKQRKNQLGRLQEEAKEGEKGLWSLETCDGMK